MCILWTRGNHSGIYYSWMVLYRIFAQVNIISSVSYRQFKVNGWSYDWSVGWPTVIILLV